MIINNLGVIESELPKFMNVYQMVGTTIFYLTIV